MVRIYTKAILETSNNISDMLFQFQHISMVRRLLKAIHHNSYPCQTGGLRKKHGFWIKSWIDLPTHYLHIVSDARGGASNIQNNLTYIQLAGYYLTIHQSYVLKSTSALCIPVRVLFFLLLQYYSCRWSKIVGEPGRDLSLILLDASPTSQSSYTINVQTLDTL
jgi:hypothetical protein